MFAGPNVDIVSQILSFIASFRNLGPWLVVLSVAFAKAEYCSSSEWRKLYDVLNYAHTNTAYRDVVCQDVLTLIDEVGMQWYKQNYQDCVEGLLSLVLYMSWQNVDRRESLIDLASHTARELNPLALQHGLTSWPMFGLLEKLHLVWQAGERAQPLSTEPLRDSPCNGFLPAIVSPFMAAIGSNGMDLIRSLGQGAFVVDAGVFDGTDWTMQSVLAGATVLGFEASSRNLRLFEERFPLALGAADPDAIASVDVALGSLWTHCRRHTVLRVEPGEATPQTPWEDLLPPHTHDACACAQRAPAKEAFGGKVSWRRGDYRSGEEEDRRHPGHAFVLGAALGDKVQGLNITTRYDYTSVADQGYLAGPKDMTTEEVAMTTLDHVVGTYMAAAEHGREWIDVLKVDVEGYEMGVLRGAERLLAEAGVRYIVLEFHPGMLGTTGTDPRGLLEFLRHYCFLCHSSKIDRPHAFDDFVARYTSNPDWLPLQGLGALEDLVCQNMAFGVKRAH